MVYRQLNAAAAVYFVLFLFVNDTYFYKCNDDSYHCSCRYRFGCLSNWSNVYIFHICFVEAVIVWSKWRPRQWLSISFIAFLPLVPKRDQAINAFFSLTLFIYAKEDFSFRLSNWKITANSVVYQILTSTISKCDFEEILQTDIYIAHLKRCSGNESMRMYEDWSIDAMSKGSVQVILAQYQQVSLRRVRGWPFSMISSDLFQG